MPTTQTDDGVTLAFDLHGPADGPAILFVNSLGCDMRMWKGQIEALQGKFRTIVYDARGHGRSEAPAGPYSLDRLARDALAILDAAEAPAVHVCGLSLGGLVAQWLALQAGDRVKGLTLANTAARIGTEVAWRDRAALARKQGLAPIADMVIPRFFSAAFRTYAPDQVEAVRRQLLDGSATGYAASCQALASADLREAVRSIRQPTTVVTGSLDVATPPEQGAALADAIPDARLVELPAAHLSNVEAPRPFNEVLSKGVA